MAEWIVEGQPAFDVWHMDSRRFGRHYGSRAYTLARTRGRSIRSTTTSDIRARSDSPGDRSACPRPTRGSWSWTRRFGEKSGWERPNWFETNAPGGDPSHRPRGWAGEIWSPAIEAEHVACRERAALFDETSFSKIEVRGAGAAAFLQRLCANDVARAPGTVTYTQMLNARGGIECDVTVTRLDDEHFRIVTGTAFGQHDLTWIRAPTHPTTARSRSRT